MRWWDNRSGHVYVIEGDHGAVKVGHSVDPPQRLGTLQTGSPFNLRVVHSLFVEKDASAVEASARATLSRWNIRGEWFDVTADVAIAAVYGAAARLGALNYQPTNKGRNDMAVKNKSFITLFYAFLWSVPFWLIAFSGFGSVAPFYLLLPIIVFGFRLRAWPPGSKVEGAIFVALGWLIAIVPALSIAAGKSG